MKRTHVLMLALILTLVVVYFAPEPPRAQVVGVRSHLSPEQPTDNAFSRSVSSPDNMTESLTLEIKRQWPVQKLTDLFAAKPKPLPPPPVTIVPPKPTAPPLPFTYVGKVLDDGKLTVFVARQQQNFLLKGGETLEGTYHVDKIESGKVVFTYLPLGTEQIMTFGGSD